MTWFLEFQIPNFLEIFYLLERDFVGLFVTPNLSKSDLLWLELQKSENFGIREFMWWVEELN